MLENWRVGSAANAPGIAPVLLGSESRSATRAAPGGVRLHRSPRPWLNVRSTPTHPALSLSEFLLVRITL